jgi:Uncharacterized conserved protein (DUF2278)
MALDHYGVLVGTLLRHFRDQPDDQGRWFHVHLEVEAPGGLYRCAVDVDSHFSDVGVQWKVGSGPGAVPGLLQVRFPDPPAEPGVRLSPHRALHEVMPLGWGLSLWAARGSGCCCLDSGSGSRGPSRS